MRSEWNEAGTSASVPKDLADHEEAIKEFSLTAVDSRKFIQTEKLKAWFSVDDARVERLLGLAYPGLDTPGLPIRSTELSPSAQPSYLLVFSLLLQLGIGNSIHAFKYNGLHDENLPISLDMIQRTLEMAPELDGIGGLSIEQHAELFNRKQYAYCPARFEYPHRRAYTSADILPILWKDIISSKGTTAAIWQIVVPQEFVSQSLRDELQGSLFDPLDDNIGPRYRLAMKMFTSLNKAFYDTERGAFDNLFQHTGMLRCFGHFNQPDDHGNEWYHLLLEYGQLDLDEYFFERTRPLFPDQIADFWECICDIVTAISKLHEFESPRVGISDVFHGCHADIKPDNILLVDGVFKIADPGLASFIKKEIREKLKRRGEKVFVKGGTATFGAPECHMGNLGTGEVTNKIDVWSLGCVLSIAATWVVLDKFGLLDYDRFRQQAIAKHTQLPEPREITIDEGQNQRYADWFHNGERVLPAIKEWHEYLRLASISEDLLTDKILDLVDETMLCEEQQRWSAKDIGNHVRNLISSFRATYQDGKKRTFQDLPASIKDFISTQNQQVFKSGHIAPGNSASSLPSTLEPQETNPRKERKSELFQNTLKLYNSAAIRNSSLRPSTILEQEEHKKEISKDDQTQQAADLPLTRSPDRAASYSSGGLLITSPQRSSSSAATRSMTTTSALPQGSKTIFDLDFEAQSKKINKLLGFLKGKTPHKAKSKDEELAQHFGNRDIHFLVDNGNSMIEVWSATSTVLHRLVNYARGQDPDGMDLTFTHGDWTLQKCNNATKFVDMMKTAKPNEKISTSTDISVGLNKILKPYVKYAPNVRDLVVIVLTDGKWDGMRDKTSIGDTIVEFYNDLKKRVRSSIDKQVGFSFVHMGEKDDEAYKRLTHLDQYLAKERGIPDMIDTIHWSGDARKMLLGSFVDIFDIMGEAEESEEIMPEPEPDLDLNSSRPIRYDSLRTARPSQTWK